MSTEDDDADLTMPPSDDDVNLTGRLWALRQAFRRAHEQLDVTIDLLSHDDESEPAPSVPPQ